jgi:hypothetical protein
MTSSVRSVVAGAAGVVARAGAAGVLGGPATTGTVTPGMMGLLRGGAAVQIFSTGAAFSKGQTHAAQAPWRDVDIAVVSRANAVSASSE